MDLDEGGENKFSMSDNFVEDLPVLGRSYQNVLKLAPGVNDSNGDGNPNVHGARERDFKATVDGVSNVDPLTGTFMSNVNPDAIEEIEVVTTGAGAEYGGAVGGFGKIITKQGTNAFDGSFSIYLRSSIFDGGTVATGTDAEPIAYHDVRPTLNFTGPIIKDKLFFALFHEYQDRGRPVNFVGSGGIVIATKGTRNLDKLTWQVSPRNKLVFQAQSDPLRVEPLGVDALTSPDSGFAYKQGGPVYQLHWDSQVSSVFNIQSLLGASHTGIDAIPTTNGVKNNCGIDTEYLQGNRHDPFGGPVAQAIDEDQCFESYTSRTTGSYLERYNDDRIRYTARSDASYFIENFLGISHTVKAGVVAQKTRFSANDQYRGLLDLQRAAGRLRRARHRRLHRRGRPQPPGLLPGLPRFRLQRGQRLELRPVHRGPVPAAAERLDEGRAARRAGEPEGARVPSISIPRPSTRPTWRGTTRASPAARTRTAAPARTSRRSTSTFRFP